MNKNAVVFSSWVQSNVLHRGNIYLSFIRDYFGDCDVFIGINSGSDLAWVDMIEANLPNAQIALVDPELSLDSDTAGFQAALGLMKSSDVTYDKVYFMHSKGMSYPSDSTWYVSCRDYFMQFAEKRKDFDKLLESENIGGWAHIARKFDMPASKNYELMKALITGYDKTTQPQDTMWLLTHYAIKGEIVKWFLDNSTQEFYTTNLKDRYFFEVCFPLIVDLYGKTRLNEVFWE